MIATKRGLGSWWRQSSGNRRGADIKRPTGGRSQMGSNGGKAQVGDENGRSLVAGREELEWGPVVAELR
ncbi:hypothetical protein GUJ93_ZPchr0012g21429 [Zizania palustris]|uniref:Uncharacterized protein n=1 Tax=Zizania palustris TaxID=103762 RepID=A0A8J5WU77_ZIZPA|nr:hypothetical protein GUJ93_ZPchr0012g21429 [Zizania palustris]